MFAETELNIAVVCGSVSGNLMQIDCETPRSFDREYECCYCHGVTNTWIDRSPSGGGHIWLRLPYSVKTRGKHDDVEILSEGRISVIPPSIAVSKIDGSLRPYSFQNRPAQILTVESLDQISWLNLEPASLYVPFKAYPRKAQRLLEGEWDRNVYETRSEQEQAIVTVLVNACFSFEEILSAFRRYPAAGKFHSINSKDPGAASDYLRLCWSKARAWTIRESPARKNAIELLNYSQSIPWRGRSGSTRRAIFRAHCGLCYRSGGPTYHASVRDIAELAGVDKNTASTATAALCRAGAIKLKQQSAFTFARRFELPTAKELEKNTEFHTLPKPTCEGVYEVSSFLVPEAFRTRGLGRPAFECLQHLNAGPLSCAQLAEKTGRCIETVRDAVKKLKKHGLAVKTGKLWRGRGLESIDFDALAQAVRMKGHAMHQRERHRADRLRHRLKAKLRHEYEQREHGDL